MYICENCGVEFLRDWRQAKVCNKRASIPRFCSPVCARSFSSKKSKGKKKLIPCSRCNRLIEVDCHRSAKAFICDICKNEKKRQKKKEKKSETLFSEKKTTSHNKEILFQKFSEDLPVGRFIRSGFYNQKSKSLKKLGFDFLNPNVEFEYLKVQKFLITEIELFSKSFCQVEGENGLANGTLKHLAPLFEITPRTLREAISLSTYSGKVKAPTPKATKYQQGHHLDWQGNDHFLRSSLEFEVAEWLDSNLISYDTETLKIRYFDEASGVYRTGIPDFIIPGSRLVIETKGSYFYDPKNLSSRKKILNCLGYKYVVLVDNILFLEEDFPEIEVLRKELPQRKTSSDIQKDYFNQSAFSWKEYEKQCKLEIENKLKSDLFQKIKTLIETNKK